MAGSVTKHNLDFTNVKEGGNFSKKHMPAGDYLAKITKVEDAQPKDKSDKTPMWLFTIQLKSTPSATYPYYCKLQDNQLWKVRNMLVAAGINVPKKKVAVDPSKLIGKIVAVSLDDTEYNGKDQSEIAAVFSPNDLDASVEAEDDDVDEPDEDDEDVAEDDDEEEAPKKKKAKEPEPEEDEEEEDDDDEPADPFDAMDRAELKAYIAENELDVKVKKSMDEDDIRTAVRAAIAAGGDDDEEEEEPEPPKKLTKKERAAARKAKAAAEAASDDEDDDEIDIEDLD